METPHYQQGCWQRCPARGPVAGKDRALLPAACPAVAPAPSGKPAFVGKGEQEERRFISTRCPRSQRDSVRSSGDLLHRRGDTGLGHGPGWQQTPVPTRGLSSGLREVEKPRGPAVGEGVSGHGWERWVWAPRQGLLAGGGKISTVKCSVKSRFSGESVLPVPDSLRSGAGTPPGTRELNLQSSPPPRALEKLVTALTICRGLTDAWKLHTSPSYEENGFSSPVPLRRAGINETLTLRHLFRPCQLGAGARSSRGSGGTCRCSLLLWDLLPVGPRDAPAPLCPQHHRFGTPRPPAAPPARSIPGRAPLS